MNSKNIFYGLIILIFSTIVSCNKSSQGASLKVRMKDNPIDLQEVNVEILEIQMHLSTNKDSSDTSSTNNGWISLDTKEGIYDLLQLQNGITETLVNSDDIPVGHLSKIRLILGENNTIMIDSVIHNIKTPSAQNTGLKLSIHEDIKSGKTYDILFDFDAEKSIVENGNGDYSLKPVLRLEEFIEN